MSNPCGTERSLTLRGSDRTLRGSDWRRRVAPATLVLLYHRVLPRPGRDVNRLAVSTANFAQQLGWLAERCRSLAPEKVAEAAGRRRLALDGRPRVLITFDDGYADNVRYALPLLRSHGLRAVLFVTTGAIGSGESFWWDALAQIVQRPEFHARREEQMQTGVEAASEYEALHRWLKPMRADERRRALAAMADKAGHVLRAGPDDRPASWDELRAWVAAGMAVGGHTRTHAWLAGMSAAEQAAEIEGARRDLEANLGIAAEGFAYPYGTPADVDTASVAAVRAAGYRWAVTNCAGNVRWAHDRFRVPRCLVRDWSAEELAAHVGRWCGDA